MRWQLTRRSWLQAAGLGSLLTGATAWSKSLQEPGSAPEVPHDAHAAHSGAHLQGTVGRVAPISLDPMRYLRTWNFNHLPPGEQARFYRETPRPDGSLLREYEIFAVD